MSILRGNDGSIGYLRNSDGDVIPGKVAINATLSYPMFVQGQSVRIGMTIDELARMPDDIFRKVMKIRNAIRQEQESP